MSAATDQRIEKYRAEAHLLTEERDEAVANLARALEMVAQLYTACERSTPDRADLRWHLETMGSALVLLKELRVHGGQG